MFIYFKASFNFVSLQLQMKAMAVFGNDKVRYFISCSKVPECTSKLFTKGFYELLTVTFQGQILISIYY